MFLLILREALRHPWDMGISLLLDNLQVVSWTVEVISLDVFLYYAFKVWEKKSLRRRDVLIFSFTLMFLEVSYIGTSVCSKAGYVVGF